MIFRAFIRRSIGLASFVAIVTMVGAVVENEGLDRLGRVLSPYEPMTDAEVRYALQQARTTLQERRAYPKASCERQVAEQYRFRWTKEGMQEAIAECLMHLKNSPEPAADAIIQAHKDEYELSADRYDRERKARTALMWAGGAFYSLCLIVFGRWLALWLRGRPKELAILQLQRARRVLGAAVESAGKPNVARAMSEAAKQYADLEKLRENGLITDDAFLKRKDEIRASVEKASSV